MLNGISPRLTYSNVMATVAAFLASGGGAYALSGVPDRGGVFHGCVSNRTGVLRVVKSASSCHRAKSRGRHRDPGEFAVRWNQTGRPGAMEVAERMRAAVERHSFPLVTAGAVTVSLGVATSPADGADATALTATAERALNHARERGRNCVETQISRAA